MCCFSQAVEHVSDTSIFARAAGDRQFLVYSMSYRAADELAMVLPLPVPPRPADDAVRFVNLDGYPAFFGELSRGFPRLSRSAELSLGEGPTARPKLEVHDVGSFEASFVPCIEDFDRLDERFRIPAQAWSQVPGYADYGFAVFKLKAAVSSLEVHPMAFEFPTRNPGTLFFPTVHVHDRHFHAGARFDHTLYCQSPSRIENTRVWDLSAEPAASFVDIARAQGIVDPAARCWRLFLDGFRKNVDVWVGADESIPGPAYLFSLSYRDGRGEAVAERFGDGAFIQLGGPVGPFLHSNPDDSTEAQAFVRMQGGRAWLGRGFLSPPLHVNGARIDEAAELSDGDTIGIGEIELRFQKL